MNKQELIATYKRISNFAETVETKSVIEKLKQLEEPKTKVPQFVADWIEECKENNIISLSGAFEYAKEEVDTWLSDWKNQETFARAWLDGYEVEKEKRYLVKMKNAYYNKYPQFLCETDNGIFWAAEIDLRKTKFTRKELKQSGFGWVFECPGMEVEEVE